MTFDSYFYGLSLLAIFLVAFILIAGASEAGEWIGLRSRQDKPGESGAAGTLAGAALGLLALLIAFSFSIALSRYDARRDNVLEEAAAIRTAANYTMMLPHQTQKPILKLLREYASVRIGLGVPYDSVKMDKDVARSLQIQRSLWQEAVAVTAAGPQSLPDYRFVSSLNEISNVQEKRLTMLRTHLPVAVVLMLIGTAMVAMGFVGYHAGVEGRRRLAARLIMSCTIAALITLIIDLDRPSAGLIQVSVEPLIDVTQSISP